MPRVWNRRDPNCTADAVYVGRPSKWGNPWKVDATHTRSQVIHNYRAWLSYQQKHGRLDAAELRGKDLVCWCAPLPCHGDVLLEIANKEADHA